MSTADQEPLLRRAIHVRCQGAQHVIGLLDGRVVAPVHSPAEIERELARDPSGEGLTGCFAILARGEQSRLDQPLRNAIGAGSFDEIRIFLAQGMNPDTCTRSGDTALSMAVLRRRPDLVRELLEAGADVEFGDNRALRTAVRLRDAESVRFLLRAGADLYSVDKYGYVVLNDVFDSRDAGLLAAAVASGQRDAEGGTPLHIATRRQPPEVVALLLAAGADPRARDTHDRTPGDLAISAARHDHIRLLVTHSTHATSDEQGATAAHRAAAAGDGNLIRDLLHAGTDCDAPNHSGWTPLLIAADHGRVEVARILLESGANPDARTSNGWSALHVAVVYRHAAIARALLDAGASIAPETADGSTPLGLATTAGMVGMQRLLREYSVDQ
ncbi:ankyrin repeat domain-containing protein [Nocardia sp. NPDC048505]|uniref:ankyrin repeat domain-containing protein n=1 Tax=unclassified Nocardia TaxID=2637762 RepID=UPI0033E84B13